MPSIASNLPLASKNQDAGLSLPTREHDMQTQIIGTQIKAQPARRSLRARQKSAPFQIGDRVCIATGGHVLTVSWSSKTPSMRGDQMIATEHNGFCHPRSDADLYELAEEA